MEYTIYCFQGMIALILETIDHCSQFKSMRHLAHLIGEDSAGRWNDMISYLYLLLGKGTSGKYMTVWKNKLLVKFSDYDDSI